MASMTAEQRRLLERVEAWVRPWRHAPAQPGRCTPEGLASESWYRERVGVYVPHGSLVSGTVGIVHVICGSGPRYLVCLPEWGGWTDCASVQAGLDAVDEALNIAGYTLFNE